MRPVRFFAFAQRALEIGEGPAADAGFLVGRDVRAVEGAERRFQRAAAGVGRRVLALFGVAAEAAARFGQIPAALRVALREGHRGAQQKEKPRRGGASQKHETLLFLAEVVVAAAAGLADRADLRLGGGLIAALRYFPELVRLV